jgi:hypothetical protein
MLTLPRFKESDIGQSFRSALLRAEKPAGDERLVHYRPDEGNKVL